MAPHQSSSELSHTPLNHWSAMQLGHYLHSIKQMDKILCDPNPFELLCIDVQPIRHTLSAIKRLLRDTPDMAPPWYLSQWEADLGIKLALSQIDSVMYFAHKLSIATRYQELGFKILTR